MKKLLGGFGRLFFAFAVWTTIILVGFVIMALLIGWTLPYARVLLPDLLARISVSLFYALIASTIVGNLVVFLDRRKRKKSEKTAVAE